MRSNQSETLDSDQDDVPTSDAVGGFTAIPQDVTESFAAALEGRITID